MGEIHARNYIESELEKANIEKIVHHFKLSGFDTKLFQIISLIILSFLLYLRLTIFVFFYILIKLYFRKKETFSIFVDEISSNLFTIIPAKNYAAKKPVLIFSAHFDSIISRFSYRFTRILNIVMKIILLPLYSFVLILSVLLLFDDFFGLSTSIYPFYIYLILFSSIISIFFAPIYIFMFKRNTKESQGAIDNASGVSILIELAKYYKLHPLENYDVLFLWCGAEEWGMRGSKYFCKKYMPYMRKEYTLNDSVNINIDMVGSHIGLLNKPRLAVFNRSQKLLKQLNFSADLLNIPISNHSKFIRPKSDHLSFKKQTRRLSQRGFQIACINSIKDTKFIHTVKDTPEKCSTENLFDCFKICLFTSRLLDSEVRG